MIEVIAWIVAPATIIYVMGIGIYILLLLLIWNGMYQMEKTKRNLISCIVLTVFLTYLLFVGTVWTIVANTDFVYI